MCVFHVYLCRKSVVLDMYVPLFVGHESKISRPCINARICIILKEGLDTFRTEQTVTFKQTNQNYVTLPNARLISRHVLVPPAGGRRRRRRRRG